uniref:Uncharacterized protein n=1 Tax=Ixodes ricinus TaxID=34613 RepID=A0A6B0U342_IXORI
MIPYICVRSSCPASVVVFNTSYFTALESKKIPYDRRASSAEPRRPFATNLHAELTDHTFNESTLFTEPHNKRRQEYLVRRTLKSTHACA